MGLAARPAADGDELHVAAQGAEAIVTLLHDQRRRALLDAAGPSLRVVANVAVGYDNVDVDACLARGVVATNTPVLTDATADIALALILMSTRRLGESERLVRVGGTWTWDMFFQLVTGSRASGSGSSVGQIGTATARRARALGMAIDYCGRRRADTGSEEELDAVPAPSRSWSPRPTSCPSTARSRLETTHLVDAAVLARMKPTAFLINTTRGPVVDEAARRRARDGTIAGPASTSTERSRSCTRPARARERRPLPPSAPATVETCTAMAVLAARTPSPSSAVTRR